MPKKETTASQIFLLRNKLFKASIKCSKNISSTLLSIIIEWAQNIFCKFYNQKLLNSQRVQIRGSRQLASVKSSLAKTLNLLSLNPNCKLPRKNNEIMYLLLRSFFYLPTTASERNYVRMHVHVHNTHIRIPAAKKCAEKH